ncbi:MAG TPA: DMT family transporter [Gemmatimonadaceae bacterium]|nr:DMT family transporter [Gemmatimonadaceae bacterium]
MRGRPLAYVFLLIAILIWGFAYIVTKSGLDAVPPMMFALLRYAVASLLLVPLALARGGLKRLPQPVPWKTLFLMALAGVALYYVLFNLALAYTSASQTALIQSAFPAIVAILAVLWLRERVTRQRFAGIGLAIVGVVLIVATQDDAAARNPMLGNALAFASVLSWSVYTILAKRISNADPIAVTAAISLIGTVMLVPAALLENADASLSGISRDGWLAILYLGGLASAASYLLYSRALRDIDASLVGAFINLSPVIGVVSGVLVLGEPIRTTAILGGVLVLAGVWLSSRKSAST